jgi:acetylornithine aminotransferase
LGTIANDGLLENVKRQSEKLRDGIEGLGHPLIGHVRGAGLLLGIVLTEPLAAKAQQVAQDAGFLVNAPAPDVVRLMPPLILGDDEVEALLQALPGILDEAGVADGDG